VRTSASRGSKGDVMRAIPEWDARRARIEQRGRGGDYGGDERS
jgi:hypothetical protein